MLAAAVLQKLADRSGMESYLEVTVENNPELDLSELDVTRHAGVLLDGVGDVALLKPHREVLQGRPKVTRGGRSTTMIYSYPFTLCRRAVIATFDLSAHNLHLFRTDHWLKHPENVIVLRLTGPAWQADGSEQPQAPRRRDIMHEWTVSETFRFLQECDLEGPAKVLRENGVAGADLLAMSAPDFVQEVRLTPFAARKVEAAAKRFLVGA